MLTCLNPVPISKRNYRNIQRYSFGNLLVGCGNCENCRKLRSLDYTIRSYYDYLWFTSTDYNNFKGFVMFDTLTYDDRHLPKKKIFGKEFVCFSSQDIRNFKSKLEKSAVNRLLDIRHLSHNPKNRSEVRSEIRKCFRVNITEEFGEQKHRPHIHILVYNKIPEFTSSIIETLYMSSWTDSKGKMLGGVEDIPSKNKIVQGLGKIIYISGYVNKDTEFYTKELTDVLKSLTKKEQNEFIPHNYYYRGFGIHLFDYYTESDLLERGAKIKLPDGKNGYKYFTLPKYNLDKLIRDVQKVEDEDGKKVYLRVLNKRGADYYRNVFRQKHIEMENDYDELLNIAKNYQYVDNSQYNLGDEDKYTWYNMLKKKMKEADVNCYQLATYSMLYRGRYGAINPDTGQARPLKLDNVERRLKECYNDKYHSDYETIQKIYQSGIFHNEKLDEIVGMFEYLNRFKSVNKVEEKKYLEAPKSRFVSKKKNHMKLKTL